MLVKDYMTRHPLMADPAMSILEAQRFMGENSIRHLPVVGDGKRLLGLVTRQSLMMDPSRMASLDVWEIARYLSRYTLKDVMIKKRDVVCVEQNTAIEQAACTMVEHRIGSLPVVEDGVLMGMITEMDLLAQLVDMLGTRQPGVRATMRMPNVHGELVKLMSAIAAQGWGILALGGADAPKHPGQWDAVVKINNAPPDQVRAVLNQVEGQQVIDIRTT